MFRFTNGTVNTYNEKFIENIVEYKIDCKYGDEFLTETHNFIENIFPYDGELDCVLEKLRTSLVKQKNIHFIGDGRNGKTTLLTLLKKSLGNSMEQQSCVHCELGNIIDHENPANIVYKIRQSGTIIFETNRFLINSDKEIDTIFFRTKFVSPKDFNSNNCATTDETNSCVDYYATDEDLNKMVPSFMYMLLGCKL